MPSSAQCGPSSSNANPAAVVAARTFDATSSLGPGRRAPARAHQAAASARRPRAHGAVRGPDHPADALRARQPRLGGPVLPGREPAVSTSSSSTRRRRSGSPTLSAPWDGRASVVVVGDSKQMPPTTFGESACCRTTSTAPTEDDGRRGRREHPDRGRRQPGCRSVGSPGTTAARTSRSSPSATSSTTTASCRRSPRRPRRSEDRLAGGTRHQPGARRRHVPSKARRASCSGPTRRRRKPSSPTSSVDSPSSPDESPVRRRGHLQPPAAHLHRGPHPRQRQRAHGAGPRRARGRGTVRQEPGERPGRRARRDPVLDRLQRQRQGRRAPQLRTADPCGRRAPTERRGDSRPPAGRALHLVRPGSAEGRGDAVRGHQAPARLPRAGAHGTRGSGRRHPRQSAPARTVTATRSPAPCKPAASSCGRTSGCRTSASTSPWPRPSDPGSHCSRCCSTVPEWAARRTVGDRDGLPRQVLADMMRWPGGRPRVDAGVGRPPPRRGRAPGRRGELGKRAARGVTTCPGAARYDDGRTTDAHRARPPATHRRRRPDTERHAAQEHPHAGVPTGCTSTTGGTGGPRAVRAPPPRTSSSARRPPCSLLGGAGAAGHHRTWSTPRGPCTPTDSPVTSLPASTSRGSTRVESRLCRGLHPATAGGRPRRVLRVAAGQDGLDLARVPDLGRR